MEIIKLTDTVILSMALFNEDACLHAINNQVSISDALSLLSSS